MYLHRYGLFFLLLLLLLVFFLFFLREVWPSFLKYVRTSLHVILLHSRWRAFHVAFRTTHHSGGPYLLGTY
ncbi:hypothetical protein F4809DRAFT_626411 [Biscogniauxia mediterranea]|nr:hypothetical protein F4809DRAFT_626411 [Biscogniauxia mediterranea]